MACSFKRSSIRPPDPIASSANDITVPFVLTIVEELNDGERLHVLAGVKANIPWDLRQVVLRLTSLHEGEVVGESFFPLETLLATEPHAREEDINVIKEGEEKRVALSVAAKNFSDYQLDLLWGKEAEQYIAKTHAEVKEQSPLQIRSISLVRARGKCPAGGALCPENLSIKGEIFNPGPKISGKATLGVSFAWVKRGESLDLSKFVPENEEFVEIPSLILDQGGGQHFNIAIDQSIPERRDGHFQPVVRVVDNEHRGTRTDSAQTE